MLEAVVRTLSESRIDEIVVVLGHNSELVRRKVVLGRARVVTNKDYDKGLGSSIKVGIESLHSDSKAVVLALADQPLVSVATINALVLGYLETGGPVVAPYFRGRRGNPLLFDHKLFPYLKKIQGDRGAKMVIKELGWKVVRVNVKDPGVIQDIDVEEDYDRALAELSEDISEH